VTAASSSTPEATYEYFDGGGALVGVVERHAASGPDQRKRFVQLRAVEGKLVPGLEGVQLPLYRLPELRDALARPERVFVVEGEKCVEALREHGVVATTNAGGAGQWRPHHTEELRGADVVVLPDRDEPGKRHADRVCGELLRVGAHVRRLELPDLPAGGDIVDWLRRGGTVNELRVLAATVPVLVEAPASNRWETPAPFGAPSDPKQFPLDDALPPTLAEFARDAARVVRVDELSAAALVPVIVSVAAGNMNAVRVSPSHREPNLSRYAVLIMPPGERKSALFSKVQAPLNSWTKRMAPTREAREVKYKSDTDFFTKKANCTALAAAKEAEPEKAEALRAAAEEARAQIPKPPRLPILSVGDVTSESLVRLMRQGGGAFALLSADARKQTDVILGRYLEGGTDESIYLCAHGGDVIDRSRIGSDGKGEFVAIHNPSLAIAFALQPDKVVEFVERKSMLDSGLLPRFNFAQPRSLVGQRIETGNEPPLDAKVMAAFERGIHAILDLRWQKLNELPDGCIEAEELELDPEAMELRRAFANELEARQAPGGDLAHCCAFASKAAGEAARLAGLFHLFELALAGRVAQATSTKISTAIWQLAERHQRAQLEETLRCLIVAQTGDDERLATRLFNWARSKPAERSVVTARDLIAAHLAADADEAEQRMRWLCERNWARPAPPSDGQRAKRWELHPSVFEGNAQ